MFLKYNSFKFLKQNLFFNYFKWFKFKHYVCHKFNFTFFKNNQFFKEIKGYRGFILKKFRKFLWNKKINLKYF